MPSYRICPTCKAKNPIDEFLCIECMSDISNTPIITEEEKEPEIEQDKIKNEIPTNKVQSSIQEENIADKTIIEKRDSIILKHHDFVLEIYSGDIIGREEKGKEYLKNFPTVSRKHARFTKEFNGWYIEDLGSTNGTYVNQKRITEKTLIKSGDVISLSNSFSVKIEIK